MAKVKTSYVCQSCGANAAKWVGCCASCGEWNTYVEEILPSKNEIKKGWISPSGSFPQSLQEISFKKEVRTDTCNKEFNRVLGGGLVPGSMVLIGGEPGIGKSTLVLQVALGLSGKKVLYVSGEESLEQLKMRAIRLGRANADCYFLSETSLENVLHHISRLKPDLVIIDSIQTLSTDRIESSPGSVAQIRECTAGILRSVKTSSTPVLLIGHINKEGNLAGPKVLEHIVDTVLQFEGDRHYMYRILRSIKNRFGSTSELGIFEMQNTGLRQVSNPSELLLSHEDLGLSGTAIAASIDGMRSFLIEIQALVSSAAYGTPQRSSTGFDLRRLNMLLAVLEKRVGFKLMAKDVFLNIAGGIKVSDPALDLSVICSILSSNIDVAIDKQVCFAGEVGLSGEIRTVNRIESRIVEADKLGFREIYVPKFHKNFKISSGIKVNQIGRVEDVFRLLFA